MVTNLEPQLLRTQTYNFGICNLNLQLRQVQSRVTTSANLELQLWRPVYNLSQSRVTTSASIYYLKLQLWKQRKLKIKEYLQLV